MSEYTVNYDSFLNVFEIRKCGTYNIVDKRESNYGIIFNYDIDMNIVAITFPDPDILFGATTTELKNFANNIFT